jgi:hypothetical protein
MQIATCDRQQAEALASVRSLGIKTENRTGDGRRDTNPLDTEKGYALQKIGSA